MPNENVPSQNDRAFREMFQGFDRRLKEIERRLTGLGASNDTLSALTSIDFFYSDHSDTAVASGAFPAAGPTDVFTPARDSGLAIGLLNAIMQPPDVTGTFDAGAAVEIDNGVGFQTIVEVGSRLPSSATPNTSYVFGSWGVVPIFGGLRAGDSYDIRHAYYYPDIGGLGSSARFFTQFILLSFPLLSV